MTTVIIGAGPTGLTVGAHVPGSIVLERTSAIGGLCRSFHHDGGTWDIGGHSWHTPHARVQQLVDELCEMEYQPRRARIGWGQHLIPYPFQQHYRETRDAGVIADCDDGLRYVRPCASSNFRDHLLARFGAGIAAHFLLPYNHKLWHRGLSTMSADWTGERVAALTREADRSEPDQRKPLADNAVVGYPKHGGFDAICWALAARASVRKSAWVTGVHPKRRTVSLMTGKEVRYGRLVSTMPLRSLIDMTDDVPADVQGAASGLVALPLRVAFILTGRRLTADVQRIYSADESVVAHKIALNHNSSASLRARPRHAIIAEASAADAKGLGPTAVTCSTIDYLTELAILAPWDVIWSNEFDIPFGYPVPTLDRAERVRTCREWLATQDITIAGRFGEWAYWNSDRCFLRGLEVADEIREAM